MSDAGPVAEQVLLLENIGTSLKVGPDQLVSLHKLLIEAAGMLQMSPPDLYIRQVSFLDTLSWIAILQINVPHVLSTVEKLLLHAESCS